MKISQIVRLALLVLLVACAARAGSFTFGLLPATGSISGSPGALGGWGYTLSNDDPAEWLVTTSLNSDAFLFGAGSLLFDFPVLSPNSSIAVPYDSSAPAGLFQILWDVDASDGFVNTGNFTLSAEWWTDDPSAGGSFDAPAVDQSQPYSATVISPEPSAEVLLVVGVFTLAFRRCLVRSAR